ncbi:MAG: hypothetical protein PWQ79_368 [Thermococcaceae archaeon]|nr:hypothetical protein [Thermococcaceae archaeon]MDK2913453.1 hypothetical protein [Thermococcaceae archaeon]
MGEVTLLLLNLSGFYGRYVYVKLELAARKNQSERLKRLAILLRKCKIFHVALAVIFLILLGIRIEGVGDWFRGALPPFLAFLSLRPLLALGL